RSFQDSHPAPPAGSGRCRQAFCLAPRTRDAAQAALQRSALPASHLRPAELPVVPVVRPQPALEVERQVLLAFALPVFLLLQPARPQAVHLQRQNGGDHLQQNHASFQSYVLKSKFLCDGNSSVSFGKLIPHESRILPGFQNGRFTILASAPFRLSTPFSPIASIRTYPSPISRSPFAPGARATLVSSATLRPSASNLPSEGALPANSNPVNLRCTWPRDRIRSTISCPM